MSQIYKRISLKYDEKLSRAVLEGKATQEAVARASSKAQWGIVFGSVGTAIALINFFSRFLK